MMNSFFFFNFKMMLFLKKYHRNNQAFTLVELIIAITILAIVLTITGASLIFINTADQKLKVSKEVYEETRFLMERIVKEIRKGTIDYEEYWSHNRNTNPATNYGENFGEYAKQFINPGTDPDGGIDEYGTECVFSDGSGDPSEKNPPCPENMTISTASIDRNTGQNPWQNDPDSNNAVCEANSCTNTAYHKQNELYLISSNGLTKTLFKRIEDDKKIGILKLIRDDEFQTEWRRHPDFSDIGNAAQNSDDFIAITPPGLEIVDIAFYIAPLEDPRKAFFEDSKAIQHQPHVTIVLTARASKERSAAIRGLAPEITLQTTITTRAYHEIKSSF